MILSLFKRKPDARAVGQVYASIVAQSRQEIFYARWDVPDTLNGRFDMISLHLSLLFQALRTSREQDRQFSQAVFDLFFKDMDRSLREMGVGDMAVPKKIQKMGELFYGMLSSLTGALEGNDREALVQTLSRNIYDGQTPPGLDRLADYVLDLSGQFAEMDPDVIVKGNLEMEAAK